MTAEERDRRTAELIAQRIARGQAPHIESPTPYLLLDALLSASARGGAHEPAA